MILVHFMCFLSCYSERAIVWNIYYLSCFWKQLCRMIVFHMFINWKQFRIVLFTVFSYLFLLSTPFQLFGLISWNIIVFKKWIYFFFSICSIFTVVLWQFTYGFIDNDPLCSEICIVMEKYIFNIVFCAFLINFYFWQIF